MCVNFIFVFAERQRQMNKLKTNKNWYYLQMEVSKNEKNKQLFNVCYEEAYTPDVLKISCFSFLLLFLLNFLSKFTSTFLYSESQHRMAQKPLRYNVYRFASVVVGSLNNDDGDGYENVT